MKFKNLLLTIAISALPFAAVNAQALNDHQIAEILETANDAEIDAAKLAEDDAENKEVKEFAKHMINEHKMNNKDMKSVVKKTKIDPEKSELSKALKENAKNMKDLLKKQDDLAFDKLYIEQQITMHTQLLNDLEQKFIPAAQKPEFKAHLEKTKTHVQAHLEKAKAIQAKL